MNPFIYEPEKLELSRANKADVQYVMSGYVNEVVKSKSEGKYKIPATFSDESVDRMGDVILASAYNTTKNHERFFNGNPVMLWAHNKFIDFHNGIPLGSIEEPSFVDKRLDGIANFKGAQYDEFTSKIHGLYQNGTLRAFSVGFRALTVSYEPIKEGQDGVTFLEVELLEISAVPIPANPNALAKSVNSGLINSDFVEQHFKKFVDAIVQHKTFFMPVEYRNLDMFKGIEFKIATKDEKEEATCTCKIKSKETKPEIKSSEHNYECGFCRTSSVIKYVTETEYTKAISSGQDEKIQGILMVQEYEDIFGDKSLNFTCPACQVSEKEAVEIKLQLL
jgi:HK97 family phage prohead protease